ncbi:MAG: TetR/AcrR family transcriptional regulator [Anaerolineae bacterium]|nr:TetR/AcrR family transcriptional regulator [Anaerolineae bacterium]
MSDTIDRNDERAQRILDAAEKLITHYGYDKTTVGEIAQEAGVSKGAIYLHWNSKEALFDALLWREVTRTMKSILAYVETDPDGGTVHGFLKGMLKAISDSALITATYAQDQRILGKHLLRRDLSLLDHRFVVYRDALTRLAQVGVVRPDINPAAVAYILNAVSYGFFNLPLPVSTLSTNLVIEVLGDILERALTPEQIGGVDAGRRILVEAIQDLVSRLSTRG